jgi:hypothetical protein
VDPLLIAISNLIWRHERPSARRAATPGGYRSGQASLALSPWRRAKAELDSAMDFVAEIEAMNRKFTTFLAEF